MTEKTGKDKVAEVEPTDALRDAGQRLLGLLVQGAAQAATERVGTLSERLGTVTENGGQGLGSLFGRDHGDEESDEDGGPGSAIKSGLSGLKDKVAGLFGGAKGGGKGSGKKLKVTNIVEAIDVGLPLRTTYDLWTQFADFPGYMKKVESVEQASDEKTNWKAQIFLSHRVWEATIVDQVPDSHIVWRSKGAKGHVDGAVSFTGLGPNLTRVLLVLEYWPQGLFERTGNLWRAQGRRARLEFKHFRRHAMSNVLLHQDEVEGWRGEIHDSEVVKTHEEALDEEQRAQTEQDEGYDADRGDAGEDELFGEDEYAPDDGAQDDEAQDDVDDEAQDDEEAQDDGASEDETQGEDEDLDVLGAEDDEDVVEEPEPRQPTNGRRRREPVRARARRGG